MARNGLVRGDLASPMVLRFAHWVSRCTEVDVVKMPHLRAMIFLHMQEVWSDVRASMAQNG